MSHTIPSLLTLLGATALVAAGCSMGSAPTPTFGGPGQGDGGAGQGQDGGGPGGTGPLPFAADTPNIYVAKIKNVLVGLPPTDAELQTVTADPTQLGSLVDGWMKLPQYQTKMQRFFELAFQQTQLSSGNFVNMLDEGQLQLQVKPLLQNVQESFARTMLNLSAQGTPFTQSMTTSTYAMTTALKVFYGLLDVWQVDDGNQPHDAFKAANPTLTMTVTAKTQIPLSQTVTPGSPNFMHWYDPGVAKCSSDPISFPAAANTLFYILVSGPPGGPMIGCPYGGYASQLTAADFSDWTMTTIRPPNAGETTTQFYDLPALRGATTLVLNKPYMGFLTPAFLANWDTNMSNQMRVTMNQTFIVATGAQIDGSDTTVPTQTPGLDAMHASDQACLQCHQLLDPSRSILAATFSWNYGLQTDKNFASQPGWFAFQGVQAPMHSLSDLGKTLAGHPLLASGWAEKLCYYVDSESCEPNDPEFQNIVSLFQNSSYSWDQLVKAVVTSPITTHTASTLTATTDGETVGVARRDHLCAAWNARFSLTDFCGLDVTQPPVTTGAIYAAIGGLPSDGYARGSVAPVLPTDPTLFFRGGTENICEGLATLLIDNTKPPPGAKTWSSTNPTAAIADFVATVMGLAPSDPRASMANAMLTSHFTAAKQTSGITATAALQSTFTAACMAPSALSMGM